MLDGTVDVKTESPHGTWQRYAAGHRCAECKAAWATYCRDRARARGRRPRAVLNAAKRMGLTKQRGESQRQFEKRMAETKAWLRNEPYYQDRSERAITVHPTALGMQILQAAQARTGRDWDDLVEKLIRVSGSTVSFDEMRST